MHYLPVNTDQDTSQYDLNTSYEVVSAVHKEVRMDLLSFIEKDTHVQSCHCGKIYSVHVQAFIPSMLRLYPTPLLMVPSPWCFSEHARECLCGGGGPGGGLHHCLQPRLPALRGSPDGGLLQTPVHAGR